MSEDDRICIGMFRPHLHEIPRYRSGDRMVYCSWYSMGGALQPYNHPEVVKHWQLGMWDKPIYATRDEIIEKMAKLELEKRDATT